MSKQSKKSIFQAIFSVTGIMLLSKILGLVKQIVTSNTYGATIETDLINLSEGFIGNIKYAVVQTVLTSFVAVYLGVIKENEKSAGCFAKDTGKAISAIMLAIVAVIMIFAQPIASIIAPTYTGELNVQLAGYLRMFAPLLVLFVWISIAQALLNANKRFALCEMEGMNQSIILIVLVVFFSEKMGVFGLAVAFILSTVWNTVFLTVATRPYWGRTTGNPFRNPHVKSLLKMALPLLLGCSVVYINETVGKILVSGLPAGTVTAMGYAAVLSNLIGSFIVSFCSILFPYITTHITSGEDKNAADLASRSSVLLMLAFLPISILTIICAEDIVTIVYGRGAFTQENIRVAAAALRGYAVGFVPMIVQELFARFQYGYKNSKVPMINSTIGIAVNIVLSLLLCQEYGVSGVTFANSVSCIICGVLNVISSKKCNPHFQIRQLARHIPWLLAGGVVCVITAILCRQHIPLDAAIFRFAVVTVCSGLTYVLAVSPLLWKMIKHK